MGLNAKIELGRSRTCSESQAILYSLTGEKRENFPEQAQVSFGTRPMGRKFVSDIDMK